jgi:hypothetical protein
VISEGSLDVFRSVAVATMTGEDLLVLSVKIDRELAPVLDEIVELDFGS